MPLNEPERDPNLTYEFVPGYFMQSELAEAISDANLPPPILPRFGLMDSSPDHWKKFMEKLSRLADDATPGESYKLFVFGRHGEGFHNVAESKFGVKLWYDYWAKQDTDGVITWGPDAELTSVGEGQAMDAKRAWITELEEGLPNPGSFYLSPMKRALRTYQLTFEGIFDPTDITFRPVILEDCREHYGVNSCDQRHSLTWLRSNFPDYSIEDGFSEEDKRWKVDDRETYEHIELRALRVLDKVFKCDRQRMISVTAHSGIINGFLRAVGHPRYPLPTGGIIPVLIKCTRRS